MNEGRLLEGLKGVHEQAVEPSTEAPKLSEFQEKLQLVEYLTKQENLTEKQQKFVDEVKNSLEYLINGLLDSVDSSESYTTPESAGIASKTLIIKDEETLATVYADEIFVNPTSRANAIREYLTDQGYTQDGENEIGIQVWKKSATA